MTMEGRRADGGACCHTGDQADAEEEPTGGHRHGGDGVLEEGAVVSQTTKDNSQAVLHDTRKQWYKHGAHRNSPRKVKLI